MCHMHQVAEYMYQNAEKYKLNRNRMYILGLLHDIGYIKGADENEWASQLLELCGYKDASYVLWGNTTPKEFMLDQKVFSNSIPAELVLLWEAEMHVGENGAPVDYTEKLEEAKKIYGRYSDPYRVCTEVISWLKNRKTGRRGDAIRKITDKDVRAVSKMMRDNQQFFVDPKWCFADSYVEEKSILDLINKDGFGLVYEEDEKVIGAAFVLYYQHDTIEYKAADFNLERKLFLPKTSKAASMDIQVVDYNHYGNGIQKALIEECERRLKAEGYEYAYCTVHPDNLYSLNNFELLGYEITSYEDDKYGEGYDRYILLKKL